MRDYFIIRLYTNTVPDNDESHDRIVGVIESVSGHKKLAFHNKDELWNALTSQQDKAELEEFQ